MSKYKRFILWNCEWLIKSVMVYLIVLYYLDTRSNSRANTCIKAWLFSEGLCLLDWSQCGFARFLVSHNNQTDRKASAGDVSFKFPPYQLWMVGYWPTMALTGNGELGLDRKSTRLNSVTQWSRMPSSAWKKKSIIHSDTLYTCSLT